MPSKTRIVFQANSGGVDIGKSAWLRLESIMPSNLKILRAKDPNFDTRPLWKRCKLLYDAGVANGIIPGRLWAMRERRGLTLPESKYRQALLQVGVPKRVSAPTARGAVMGIYGVEGEHFAYRGRYYNLDQRQQQIVRQAMVRSATTFRWTIDGDRILVEHYIELMREYRPAARRRVSLPAVVASAPTPAPPRVGVWH